MVKIKKTVLVFGTFDGIHEGHRYFLREAKKNGWLIVAVAKDSTVKLLKGHMPKTPLPNRIRALKNEKIADDIVPGDQEIGYWKIIKRISPDIVCLGYDQENLRTALERSDIAKDGKFEIKKIPPFEDGHLHSSALNNI